MRVVIVHTLSVAHNETGCWVLERHARSAGFLLISIKINLVRNLLLDIITVLASRALLSLCPKVWSSICGPAPCLKRG